MHEVENYSYIVGLSQFCYYGVLSVKGTIDSSISVKYLKGVINQIKQGAKYSKEYVIILKRNHSQVRALKDIFRKSKHRIAHDSSL